MQRIYQRVYETEASYVPHMRWDSKEEKDERMNIREKEYDIGFLLDCGRGNVWQGATVETLRRDLESFGADVRRLRGV